MAFHKTGLGQQIGLVVPEEPAPAPEPRTAADEIQDEEDRRIAEQLRQAAEESQ